MSNEEIKISGAITIGDLTITEPPGPEYTGGNQPWISRADHHKSAGEGAALGPKSMAELRDLLEAFYKRVL